MTTDQGVSAMTVTTMRNTIHQGRRSRIIGKVVTLCNGRTTDGTPGASTTGALCERCFSTRTTDQEG